jgi:hypothetical protein
LIIKSATHGVSRTHIKRGKWLRNISKEMTSSTSENCAEALEYLSEECLIK